MHLVRYCVLCNSDNIHVDVSGVGVMGGAANEHH